MKVCIAKFNYFENCIPHLFIKIFYPDFIPLSLTASVTSTKHDCGEVKLPSKDAIDFFMPQMQARIRLIQNSMGYSSTPASQASHPQMPHSFSWLISYKIYTLPQKQYIQLLTSNTFKIPLIPLSFRKLPYYLNFKIFLQSNHQTAHIATKNYHHDLNCLVYRLL